MSKKILIVFLTSVLVAIPACILGFQAHRATTDLPQGSWIQLQSPVGLSHFVESAPSSSEGEDVYTKPVQVYASTADGTLYAVTCNEAECAWSKPDGLSVTPGNDPMAGSCIDDQEMEGAPKKPAAPDQIIDCYKVSYARPTGPRITYFLLQDGSVWVWDAAVKAGWSWGPIPAAINGLGWGLAGLLIGALVGVALIIIGTVIGKKREKGT